MSAVWDWLKRHWKWLLAPLWIASLVLVYLFRGGSAPLLPDSGTTDEAADDLSKEKDKALEEFRKRLDELYAQAEQRLKDASEEQIKEFEDMKEKPIEELTDWIDKLS